MDRRRVCDIMSSPVTMGRNETLDKAVELMGAFGVRHFPIVEGAKLVGVLTQRDIYHSTLGSVMHYGEHAEREFLATVQVKEVMTEAPVTVSLETTLSEAARMMADQKIGCLPVLEGNTLRGIVTKTDILREVAGWSTAKAS